MTDARVAAMMRDHLVVRAGHRETLTIISTEGDVVKPIPAVAKRLAVIPLSWNITCIVVCRDQQGEQYVICQEVPSKDGKPRAFRAMRRELDEHHTNLINGANDLHYITFGWIASPDGYGVDNDSAYYVMETLGAFDRASKWEIEKLEMVMEA